MAPGQLDGSLAGGHAETRNQDAGYPGFFGAAQDVGPVGIEFVKVQVAVGVGKYHVFRCQASGDTLLDAGQRGTWH